MKQKLFLIFLLLILATCAVFCFSACDSKITDSGEGDLYVPTGNAEVTKEVEGSVFVQMGDVRVDAPVDGDVTAVKGNITVNSRVGGNVISEMGTVTLGENARVEGNVVSFGKIIDHSNAKVVGNKTTFNGLSFGGADDFKDKTLQHIIVLIVVTMVTVFFAMILLSFTHKKLSLVAVDLVNRPVRRFTIGFLACGAAFFITLLSVITLVGPFILGLLAGIVLFIGRVVVYLYLGRVTLKLFSVYTSAYVECITGIIIVALASMLPLIVAPFAGDNTALLLAMLIEVPINAFGIGVLIDTNFGNKLSSIY